MALSRTAVKILTGTTIQLEAVPHDANGLPLPSVAVSWSSSNDGIATVTTSGMVTTVAPGLAYVRAEAGGVTDSVRLEVATATFDTVAAGGYHVCALTTDGEAYCWGENFNGALGTGDTVSSPIPLAVQTAIRFASITLSPARRVASRSRVKRAVGAPTASDSSA